MSEDLRQYNHHKYGEKEVEVSDDFIKFLYKESEAKARELDENVAWEQFRTKISTHNKSNYLWLKIAASLTLLAVVGFIVVNLSLSPQIKTVASNNDKVEVTFPDGSLGILNQASSFSYPEKFGNERRVSFTGEAYFDIQKSTKPFIIDANGVEVKVLGTAFNLITTDDEVVLYVDRGLVAFSKDGDETKVEAGLEAIFDKETNTVLIKESSAPNIMSWRNGFFKFEDTPLDRAIEDLSEYYNVEFQISNSKLNNCRISATIEEQSLGEVLGLLERILDVKVSLKDNSVKISGKGC